MSWRLPVTGYRLKGEPLAADVGHFYFGSVG